MEDVIALAVEDLLGDLRLAAHRVDGHQGPGNVDDFQQFRDRCDLVALGVGDDLTKANGVRCGPGTDHVNRRLTAGGVVTAAERLAVDGDHLPAANLVQRGDPTEQTLLELRQIDGGEDRVETIMGRDALLQIQNRENHAHCALPNSAMATKSSAPQMTAQMAIVTMFING